MSFLINPYLENWLNIFRKLNVNEQIECTHLIFNLMFSGVFNKSTIYILFELWNTKNSSIMNP